VNYAIKSVGSKDDPLPPYVLFDPQGISGLVHFPKIGKPTVEAGDRMLVYASSSGRVIGAVEVTSDPVMVDESSRWPWAVDVRFLILIPHLRDGATLAECGIDTSKMRRRSHLFLTAEQYDHGVRAVAAAAVRAAL
jgi:hypothetical protein